MINSYDWVTLGYVAGIIALLAYRSRISLLTVAVVAVIGQFTIEHVGFLFGVAAAVAALADTGAEHTHRLRTAALRLAVAGAACVSVVCISVFVSEGHSMQRLYDVDLDKAAWFKNNFDWANLVVANLITLIVLAAAGGVVAGGVGGMLSATENAPAFARVAIISAGVFGAFLVVAFAGMWFLYYPSEMGRQFAPLSLAVAIMATGGSAWAVARIRAKS